MLKGPKAHNNSELKQAADPQTPRSLLEKTRRITGDGNAHLIRKLFQPFNTRLHENLQPHLGSKNQ